MFYVNFKHSSDTDSCNWNGEGNDTVTDHTVDDTFTVSDKGEYRSIPIGFEPKYGIPYYLVYAIYSTGDSFSHQERGGIEFIDMYEDPMKAKKLKDDIIKHNNMDDSNYDLEYENSSGKLAKLYVPWKGYFERLNDVEIKLMFRNID